jgi:hypothetical protein
VGHDRFYRDGTNEVAEEALVRVRCDLASRELRLLSRLSRSPLVPVPELTASTLA